MGLEAVRLLALDCDGVLTDNRVWLTEDGRESVAFYRGDGLGIERLKATGVQVVVISAEVVPIVAHRCRKLGVECRVGVQNKLAELKAICRDWWQPMELGMFEVAYIGNDINDLECLRAVGFPFVPADAEPELLAWSWYGGKERRPNGDSWGLRRKGGRGCVREVCEMIIEAKERARAVS